jgi:hypothetical protein
MKIIANDMGLVGCSWSKLQKRGRAMNHTRRIILSFVLFLLVNTLIPAARLMGMAQPGAQEQIPVAQWKDQIAELQKQLQAGDWEEARQAARFLSESLAERSGGTFADKRNRADELTGAVFGADPVPEGVLLGQVAGYRAIAEAELGRQDDARWHWYIAQNLAPQEVRQINLKQYGEAGEFLRHQSLADAFSRHAGLVDVLDPVRPEGRYRDIFQPPVRTKVVYPRLPHDLHSRDRFSEAVNIQITVDETGKILQPLLISAGFYPGAVYRALEALGEWRFEPAKLNGKAVAYRYVVPIVFADDRPANPGTSF